MHESDAMEFLEIIYEHFGRRYFEKDYIKGKNDHYLFKIRNFIKDYQSIWVKEKATMLADYLINFELYFKKPNSLKIAIDMILKKATWEIIEWVDKQRHKGKDGCLYDSMGYTISVPELKRNKKES